MVAVLLACNDIHYQYFSIQVSNILVPGFALTFATVAKCDKKCSVAKKKYTWFATPTKLWRTNLEHAENDLYGKTHTQIAVTIR